MKCYVAIAATLLAAVVGQSASADTIYFDFGRATDVTAGVNTVSATASIADAIDVNGDATGVSLTLDPSTAWTGENTAGAALPLDDVATHFTFPLGPGGNAVTNDSVFGVGQDWNGNPAVPEILYSIAGLEPGGFYTYTFMGARASTGGPTDQRTSLFTVNGVDAPEHFAGQFDGGFQDVSQAIKVAASATGEATLRIAAGPNNTSNNGSGNIQFFYLGALKIEQVPEPTSAALLAVFGLAAGARRRSRR